MIRIQPSIIDNIKKASRLEELFPMVQSAIELEHSTIPPYLTAMFSFKPGTGSYIRTVIHSIVIEEMLHMTIACNILNALGGSPAINKKDFVPEYPGPLPMGIGGNLIVGLQGYSKEVVKNVFMEIEEPEHPLVLKDKPVAMVSAEETYKTIGDFYNALIAKINDIAPDTLPGDASKQVTSGFFAKEVLFPIIKKEDAVNAINIIIEQGEGTESSPADFDSEIAHYYKFEELYKGRQLIKDPGAPYGYSFSGDEIPFDPADVQPIFPNTKAEMLPEGSEERRRVDEFNNTYSSLLYGLHRTFNGDPGYLNQTLGLMFDMKLATEKLCAMPFPGKTGFTIGPTFEWVAQP